MSELLEIPVADFEREVSLGSTLAGRRALVQALWAVASDVGALRREGVPEWICDRASARLDVALNVACPSAAELVRAGVDVDEALEIVAERGERLRRLTGEPW